MPWGIISLLAINQQKEAVVLPHTEPSWTQPETPGPWKVVISQHLPPRDGLEMLSRLDP